jgi:hypothetical protein
VEEDTTAEDEDDEIEIVGSSGKDELSENGEVF